MTALWCEILGIDLKSADSSFLASGGDSMLALLLQKKLFSLLGHEVALQDILGASNALELARNLGRPSARSPASPFIPEPEPQFPRNELSFSQERMLFMHSLAGTTAAYHVAQAIRFRGPIRVAEMRAAIAETARRHTTLYTRIRSRGRRPQVKFDGSAVPELREIRLQQIGSKTAIDRAHDYLGEFANGPFSLEAGPLLRASLIHIGEQDSILIFVMHHIVTDQWALDVFLRDLAIVYSGRSGELGAAGNYQQYASWHRRQFTSERHGQHLAYWRRKLSGLLPVTLNEDYPRPLQQSFHGARLRTEFHLREIRALRQLGAEHGATLAMVLLTILKLLLARHSSQSDIAVGMPVANRQHPGAENLVGTLVNTLVLRTDLEGALTFVDALRCVKDNLLEALEYQDLPFEMLVQGLKLSRDPSRPPLFGVMFNMLNTPLGNLDFGDLEWSRFEFDKKASQFDLTVTIDAEHARSICFDYSTDLFSAETIRRFASQFFHLMRQVLRESLEPLAVLEQLPEAEQQLLQTWSRGARIPRSVGTIPALLRPAMLSAGRAVALEIDGHATTYAALQQEIDAVASALRAEGISKGARVGLSFARSRRMLVAQLAVLQAGAAYVPLDPQYPAARLAFMARDSSVALILHDTSQSPVAAWPDVTARSLSFDALLKHCNSESVAWDSNESLDPLPNDPAYVIYTSGSTGSPKGVVVPHRAVSNFLLSMAETPGLGPEDRLLAITTTSFDISLLELFLPLMVGARIVLARERDQIDGESLQRLVRDRAITTLQATPTTWRILLESGWTGTPGLRAFVGGESLSSELALALSRRCDEVWNMYGPTETTVWSSCAQVLDPGKQRVSIGRPIGNTQILVLNEKMAMSPVGVPGEIFIGGDGLASGYHNSPEATRARFVENPFSRDRRTRLLYRTGDRGRWRQDGMLEHLGRLDGQIKLRGYRIEPGEIEARLDSHPDLSGSVVVARELRPGDSRLVAYFVPRSVTPTTAVLRDFLRGWLPDYMVPRHFVSLDAIPLLPNGKTDRSRLPLPPDADAAGAPPVLPRSQIEKDLCQIWSELLGREGFGIRDDFFQLGGHSLLAVQLMMRVRQELQRACTLPMVFRNPTIEALGSALQSASPLFESAAIALTPRTGKPCVFALCGLRIYQQLADELAGDATLIGAFVPRELEVLSAAANSNAAAPTVRELAGEYVELIRAEQTTGPYRLLGFSFGGVLAYEVCHQLRAHGESVDFLALLDSDVPGPPRASSGRALREPASRLMAVGRYLVGRVTGSGNEQPSIDYRRYQSVMRSYAPLPLTGPAALVSSTEGSVADPGYGWSELISELRVLELDCSHLDLLQTPNVGRLAGFLRQCLAESLPRGAIAPPAVDQHHILPS